MTNILHEMIKILHEKMYLYWFHNDTSEENSSLNGHSNETWKVHTLLRENTT